MEKKTNEANETNKEVEPEVFNCDDFEDLIPELAPPDPVKALWANVILSAIKRAEGINVNCEESERDRIHNLKSSIRFLCGMGNLQIACQAVGINENKVRKLGQSYRHLLYV